MTPEERERYERIDRQLEFLANNQAQLSADIENLKQISATHTTQIVQLADTVLSLARVVEDQGQRLAAAQERTDARLNTLIGVVERFFSNGRKE